MSTKDKAVKKDESLQKGAGSVEMTQDRPVYVPSADIYEDGNAVTVYADMPGVNEKNVDITLEDDVLTIIGHQETQGPDNMELVYQGYTPGIYRRSFTLGVAVDRKKITAGIKNGILTLVLPKAAEAKPRKIAVSAG